MADDSPVEIMLDDRKALQSSGFEYVAQAGTDPSEITLDFPEEIAKSLLLSGAGSSRTIKVTMPNGNEFRLEHWSALRMLTPPIPGVGRLLLADRRWLWRYGHVFRTFNLRMRTGVKRLIATRIEISPLEEEIDFAPWSLNDGQRWTAKAVLEWMLGKIVENDQDHLPGLPGFSVQLEEGGTLDVPIEGLEVDDNHADALSRVLEHLPEMSVTVDRIGSIRVFSRTSKEGNEFVRKLPHPLVPGGIILLDSDQSIIRPREIVVRFDREIETRLDFLEPYSDTTAALPQDGRWVENVLPCPDHTLEITTANGGKQVVDEGTWITVEQAMQAWGEVPRLGVPLTHGRLHIAFAPFLDLFTALGLSGEQAPEAEWMLRIAALEQHYRRTFRINPRLRSRVRDIRAYKVGTLNTETGTRAPALVYSDYCYLASQRSIRRDLRAGVDAVYVMNVAGHENEADLADSLVAPASLRMVDVDQGVFSIEFDQAPVRLFSNVLPGQIQYGTAGISGVPVAAPNVGPTQSLRNRFIPLTFNTVADDFGDPARLVRGHAMAVVLTVVPANDTEAALQEVVVTPLDLIGVAAPSLRAMLNRSFGPTLYIRIPPSIEQARVAWADHAFERIEQALGIRTTQVPPHLDDLTVNMDNANKGATGASLASIAKAAALRAWSTFADRHEGSQSMPFSMTPRVSGWVDQVRWAISQGGEAQTIVQMAQRIPPFSLFSVMDDGTRRVVGRLVDR